MQETLVQFLGGKIPWKRDRPPTPLFLGFPCGSAGKESTCNAGNLGLIPGLGRSTGEGKGYPLQSSGLEYSMDYIGGFHGGHQELDTTESLSLFWSENAGSQGNCLFYILRSYILLAPKWLLCECLSLIHVQLFATPWTVYGILQARTLDWVAFPFSRGSSQPRGLT